MLNRDPLSFINSQIQTATMLGMYYAKQSEVSNVDQYRSKITDITQAQLTGNNGMLLGIYKAPVTYADQLLPFF